MLIIFAENLLTVIEEKNRNPEDIFIKWSFSFHVLHEMQHAKTKQPFRNSEKKKRRSF